MQNDRENRVDAAARIANALDAELTPLTSEELTAAYAALCTLIASGVESGDAGSSRFKALLSVARKFRRVLGLRLSPEQVALSLCMSHDDDYSLGRDGDDARRINIALWLAELASQGIDVSKGVQP